jgi:integrase
MTGKKERNLRLVDGKWYVDFRFKGKRHREFGGYTKEQARNTLAKLRTELLDVARGFKKPPAEDVAFETFADEFLKTYCKPNKRSWAQDERTLKALKTFFKGKTLASIDQRSIDRFKAERSVETSKTSGETVSPATVNRALALLKTLFAKAVEWGRLETNPAARVKKLKEPPNRERYLTREEARRLIGAASPELRPIIIAALGTGMRKGEILALKWADLDLVRGIITISMSKSGKARKIPTSGEVAATLGAIPHRGEYVFWNPETKTRILDVKTAFRAACRRAKKNPEDEKDPGIVGVRFHDLRHTFAGWWVEEGGDLVALSKILGHASIQMTMRYAHARPEVMRLGIERVGQILSQSGQKTDTPSTPAPRETGATVSRQYN